MSTVLKPPKPMPQKAYKAQDMVQDAWAMENPDEAFALAEKALEVFPDCADAYTVLAAYTDLREAQLSYYQKAIAAFRKWYNQKYFDENKGVFWLNLETRPFMRAMQGYGKCLWDFALSEAAIETYRYMLELNPNDNQGIRYTYLSWLIIEGHLKDARLVAAQYDYFPANFTFDTLLLNILENKSEKIIKQWYDKAVEANEFIVPFILKKKKLPGTIPDSYGFGDKGEAAIYMKDEYGLELWEKYPEAVGLLKKLTANPQ